MSCIGGFYYVKTDEKVYECKARGIFRRYGNSPLAGDRVRILIPPEGYPSVEEIIERKNFLIRPPVANLDVLVIVCSADSPAPNTLLTDKMTAIAEYHDITPVIAVTKTDIKNADEFACIYERAGIKTFLCSSVTNRGIQEFREFLQGKTAAFTGNSGVGKSSLLNALFPELGLQTGEISRKLGRGRHTTRTVELFEANGGYVADTPGFSTLDMKVLLNIPKEELQYVFAEFEPYIGTCRFTSCSHTCESGCEVIRAAKENIIPESRLESYRTIYARLREVKDWERKKK